MKKKAETYDLSFKKKAVDLYHQKKNYAAVFQRIKYSSKKHTTMGETV